MPRPARTPERVERAERLGAKIRALREQAGMSREQLARSADIATETLRKVERGATASPELFTFAAIMDHLDATMEDVVTAARSKR